LWFQGSRVRIPSLTLTSKDAPESQSVTAADSHAGREKRQVAASSVCAAIGLTGMKIVVGLLTGSLGILAEAAHSGFDLLAAVTTYFAVRFSGRRADREHPYGHGKIENLSALFETLLLLGTCIWIIFAATNRLIHKRVDVEVTFWSFVVMTVSIIVDVSRSRMLYRAADKHKSQALEADALHFSTDIWSSAVVIVGLVGVVVGDLVERLEFLHYADAVAAIAVGVIVVQVSMKLGLRTVYSLLDTAPAGLEDKIVSAVESIPSVENCHRVRIRHSGPKVFVDLHVLVDGRQSLRKAHELTEQIEQTILKIEPDADVTVHPEPV
jgi:cation diffusion facilitator family transporter